MIVTPEGYHNNNNNNYNIIFVFNICIYHSEKQNDAGYRNNNDSNSNIQIFVLQ